MILYVFDDESDVQLGRILSDTVPRFGEYIVFKNATNEAIRDFYKVLTVAYIPSADFIRGLETVMIVVKKDHTYKPKFRVV